MEKEKETMKLKRQLAGLLMILLMLTMLLPAGAYAEDGMNPNEMSGECGAGGSSVKWELSGAGDDLTLTLSGAGATRDVFASRDSNQYNLLAPKSDTAYISETWQALVSRYEKVTKIVIGEGITAIGTANFESMKNVTEVSLPSTLTSIGDWAFRGLGKVKELKIPNGVTFIGAGAFKDWASIEDLVIPDSVTVIGHANKNGYDSRIGAFQGCTSLKTVTISKNLKTIYNWTFSGCSSLKTVEIPRGITVMGTEVENTGSSEIGNPYMGGIGIFENCTSLESIILPSTIKTIYEYAFYHCDSLKDIYYEGSESEWKNVEMRNIGNWDTAMQARMHYNCKTGNIFTASDYKGESNLVIPEGVTRIDDYALTGCSNIKTVSLPSTLSYIGYYAFQNCTGLTTVTIPGSMKYVNRGAFNGCTALKEVKFNSGVSIIGTDSEGKFSGQVKPSGFGTFEGCTSLKDVYVPKSVTSIGEYSFYTCPALTDVYYEGTQDDWKKIPIVNGSNQPIIRANIHYGSYSGNGGGADRPSARYHDVDPNAWYVPYVDFAISAGIMNGTGNSTFSPNAEVTRAQLVQVLYALEKKPTVEVTKKYSDIKAGQWYAAAVSWASAFNIAAGFEDGSFKPDRSVTRQDMAVMMYAFAKYKGIETNTSASVDSFSDRGKISSYALRAMKWAVGKKYMSGMGNNTLAPRGTTTRAQLATVMKAMIG